MYCRNATNGPEQEGCGRSRNIAEDNEGQGFGLVEALDGDLQYGKGGVNWLPLLCIGDGPASEDSPSQESSIISSWALVWVCGVVFARLAVFRSTLASDEGAVKAGGGSMGLGKIAPGSRVRSGGLVRAAASRASEVAYSWGVDE